MRVSIEVTPYRWSRPGSERETIRAAIAAIVEAERAGFDAAWASEDPDSWDAIAVLSAAAAQTERIGLTTGVVNPFYRHPALLAASFSTLDRISGGRARMGLGRGQVEWYQRSLGIEIREPEGFAAANHAGPQAGVREGFGEEPGGGVVIDDEVGGH